VKMEHGRGNLCLSNFNGLPLDRIEQSRPSRIGKAESTGTSRNLCRWSDTGQPTSISSMPAGGVESGPRFEPGNPRVQIPIRLNLRSQRKSPRAPIRNAGMAPDCEATQPPPAIAASFSVARSEPRSR